MNLFGKKKSESAPKAQDPIETVKKLRDNLDILEKREQHISKKIEICLQEAKQKSAKKDKKGALFALKRKKLFEQEIEKLQGARVTMDSQIMALESATVNIETFKAMQQGAQAMRAIRGNIDSDKVDDMMDAMQEERDIHDAISEAISRPAQDMFDDEELLNELNELEAQELEEPAPAYEAPKSSIALPSAPTNTVKIKGGPITASTQEDEDERALRELQASMLA